MNSRPNPKKKTVAAHVAAFLSNGGVIHHIETGVSGSTQKVFTKLFNNKKVETNRPCGG